jgi:peptidoglycan/xylan/chitin deacetylase (PgdA/CDA1 family)
MFHRVLPKSLINDQDAYYLRGTLVSTEFLEAEILKHINEGYEFKTLLKAVESTNLKTLVITFDDGYKDNFVYAYPILNKYNIKATFYPTIGYCIDGSLAPLDYYYHYVNKYVLKNEKSIWITGDQKRKFIELKIKDQTLFVKDLFKNELPILDLEYMNSAELKTLSNSGHEIGGHTVYHDIYTNLSEEEIKSDYLLMKNYFKDLSISPLTFAYSDGRYNKFIIKMLINDGIIAACTIKASQNKFSSNHEIERDFCN